MNRLLEALRIINTIPVIIASVESAFGGKSGKEKKEAVQLRVMDMLNASELVTNRDIINQKGFKKGMNKAVDGIVEMMNSSAWKRP